MPKTRTLYIGRHAKSSWDIPGRDDVDRPLADRGVKDAYEMVRRMKERDEKPEMIISSPASRALHTAIIFARGLRFPFARFRINEDLYMGGEDAVLEVIREVDDNIGSLMIFGHNPDFTYLANYFLTETVNNIPTCGLLKLDFDAAGWMNISKTSLVHYFLDIPKKQQ
jgi:phosphohistidine phosphatase